MSDPSLAYSRMMTRDAVSDEQAKECMGELINDPVLLREVCSIFADRLNVGARCYAVGKVYDVGGGRFGCIAFLSEDAVNVIGGDGLKEVHEKINYSLACAYLENGQSPAATGTWDERLDDTMEKNFPPLFTNGIRARSLASGIVEKAFMPAIAFIVYQEYGAIYG